jgi:hypothetical protein
MANIQKRWKAYISGGDQEEYGRFLQEVQVRFDKWLSCGKKVLL